jgi:hypothetical protein
MAVDAIVRVSFDTNASANQAANKALVGHAQNARATGPFERIGTAAYSCSNASDLAVAQALGLLSAAVIQYSGSVDSIAITFVRRKAPKTAKKKTI